MCLLATNPKRYIATENIVCYKILIEDKNGIYSPFQYFIYILNKIYKYKIKREYYDKGGYDDFDTKYVENKRFYVFSKGFH